MRNNMIVHFMDYRGQFFADINCADCIYTVCAVFFMLQERAQQSWGTPIGVSPIMVITSEPYSQIRCVVVIQGTKRMGNVAS